jgi:ribosomal 50S subunit-associated protein YjgA (DUF615 family)
VLDRGDQPGARGRAIFRRAIEGWNLSVVRALAHALHQVPLPDTLAIVLLLARREPQHYSRAAARFVGRLALERPVDLGDLEAATVALLAHPHAGAAKLQVLCQQWGVPWRPPRRPPGSGAPRLR